jgi:hypothetical protein
MQCYETPDNWGRLQSNFGSILHRSPHCLRCIVDKLTRFFEGFLVWEFPTQYAGLSEYRIPTNDLLGVNVCLWGVMLMLQATTTNFGAFFALRFIMGTCLPLCSPISPRLMEHVIRNA